MAAIIETLPAHIDNLLAQIPLPNDQKIPFKFSSLEPLVFQIGLYSLLALLGLTLVSGSIGAWHRKRMVTKMTAVEDLVTVGRPRTEGKRIDGTAVIAGGSVSGLLTARICSTHFSRVLIVEPEEWTSTSAGLSAQSPETSESNSDSIDAFSYLTLKEMFPAFESEALKISPSAIGPCDYNVYPGGRILKPPSSGNLPKFVALSRPAYETLLRKLLVQQCDNVEFVTGTVTGIEIDVDGPSQGLQGAGEGDRIQSVTIRSKDGLETNESCLLLADCSGPTCAGLKWIAKAATSANLKVPKPSYDPKMYYTTCIFNANPSSMSSVPIPGGWSNARAIYNYLPDSRMDNKTFLCMRREKDTLQFAIGGFDAPAKPRSINDIKTFLKSLKTIDPVPEFMFKMLDSLKESGAEKTATYHDVRMPPAYYVKYHEVVDSLPTNFIAIGDSVMRVNPIRGQGCTKSAIGATTLSGILDYCNPVFHSNSSREVLPDQFAKIFFGRQHDRIGSVWDQTRAEDYGWESTIPAEGEKRSWGGWTRWYTNNLISVGRKNSKIGKAIYGSAMFLAPGTDVTTPSIISSVIWAGIKESIGITKYGA